MAIHLGHGLLHGSSDSSRGHERAARGPKTSLGFDLAPGGVYRLPMSPKDVRELLPHAFTLTSHMRGGLLSVALSLGSPPLAVNQHPCPVELGLSSRRTNDGSTGDHPHYSNSIFLT